ncbi:putative transcriptional regulator, XRE family [Xylanimonas cellulosilytica DSM 15894]|uniref:Transcriptional regulator, XRE family n=1 Tax=Xylanimonas cellulosilytica (strain DSM 15894 / JCM 12276 / CECT 5975 / KCTC 9989 / LMG 20990 / NBRC 107835 / XIL07) TaxID=446471 RepID=D1BWP3_XYLCX|nr:helix-turn-helix transcriptional regulator [Xylanimonas cellulosilytica]ACZ29625.1 putative transcriptional regulator, XRE family [Xylanimonas cellulosilytica DSM 15894]
MTGTVTPLSIGMRVRGARDCRGWNQTQLAEALTAAGWPMGQPTVAKIEAGLRPLRLHESVVVAKVLGTTIVGLLDDSELREIGDAFHAGVLHAINVLQREANR